MCLEIEGLNEKRMCEHVKIYRIKKKEIQRVSFGKFIKEVDKYQFLAWAKYVSTFKYNTLIDCDTMKNKYLFIVL